MCLSGKHPIHLGLQHEVILPTRTSHTYFRNRYRYRYIYIYIYLYLSIYLTIYMIVYQSCLDPDVSCYRVCVGVQTRGGWTRVWRSSPRC